MTQDEFKEFIGLIDKVFGTEALQTFNGNRARFIEGSGSNPARIELRIDSDGQLFIEYIGRRFFSGCILVRSVMINRPLGRWVLNFNDSSYLFQGFECIEDDAQRLKRICDRYNEEVEEELK